MKSKIDRAMKSTIPLWVAIAILAIVNIAMHAQVYDPDKTITAYDLNVNEIWVRDSMNDDKLIMRITGVNGGSISLGMGGQGITIHGGDVPFINLNGNAACISVKENDGRTSTMSSDGIYTTPEK